MEIRKEIVSRYNKIVGYKCNVCGTEIEVGFDELPSTWHGFMHGHDDWGTDSGDSHENFHVCSPECYFRQLEKSLIDLKEHKSTAEIDTKSYHFTKALVDHVNNVHVKHRIPSKKDVEDYISEMYEPPTRVGYENAAIREAIKRFYNWILVNAEV